LLNPSPFATVFNTYQKARVNSKARIKYTDVNEVVIDYINKMEHFKAYAEVIRKLRGVWGNKTIRTIAQQRAGAEFLKSINNHIDDLARGSVDRGKVIVAV